MYAVIRTPSFRRLAAITLVAGAGFTFWAALQPSMAPPGAYHLDKFVHVGVFAFLGGLASLAVPNRRWLVGAVFALVLLGAGIEVGQAFVPGRSGSLGDLLGDMMGIAVGIAMVEMAVPFRLRRLRP
jgi:VanZ family protein